MTLNPGMKYTHELLAEDRHTARSVGSGGVAVFATPEMILGMEHASEACVRDAVGEGNVTVGTRLDVRHLAATPAGMRVRFEAELTGVDGRRLTFRVTAHDECELIGEGEHERFIVGREKFEQRAQAKLAVRSASAE